MVDDFPRDIWIYLLKHKSETKDIFINFHKKVKTQFNKDIKRVGSDNSTEFWFLLSTLVKVELCMRLLVSVLFNKMRESNEKNRHTLNIAHAL